MGHGWTYGKGESPESISEPQWVAAMNRQTEWLIHGRYSALATGLLTLALGALCVTGAAVGDKTLAGIGATFMIVAPIFFASVLLD